MRITLSLISWLALLITALAPFLFFFDHHTEAGQRNQLLAALLGRFGVAVIRERTQTE